MAQTQCKNPCCSSLSFPLSSKPSPYAHILHQPQNRNSTTCLDQSTYSSMKAFVGAIEREMATCDEQISYVETMLSSLRAQRDKIADTIREHRAVIGAVHDIPTEILLKIFNYYLDDCNGCDLKMHRGRSGPWRLADVCRRWKEVAEATPSLWTNLTLPSQWLWFSGIHSLTKRVIRCSASDLLRLSIDLTCKFRRAANPLPLLSKHSSRWYALHVKTNASGLQQMGAPSRFDELQELWLSFTGKPDHTTEIASAFRLFDHASAPKLHVLRIDSETMEVEDESVLEPSFLHFDPLQSPNFPFASLTHVAIQASFGHNGDLFAILELCTNIEELNLTNPEDEDDHPTNRITLGCLTTLIVDGMEWVLNCIACPRIQSMTLSDIGASYILRFLQRNPGIALDSATFNSVNTHPNYRHDWREILCLLPTIRSLTLEFLLDTSTAMDAMDCDHVPFHVFRSLDGSTDACLLLKELHVVFVLGEYGLDMRSPFNLDGQALDIVFQSRQKTLSNVSVRCEGWADDSWEQQRMISELREDAARSSIYKTLAGLRDRVQVVFKSRVFASGYPDTEDDHFNTIPVMSEPSIQPPTPNSRPQLQLQPEEDFEQWLDAE